MRGRKKIEIKFIDVLHISMLYFCNKKPIYKISELTNHCKGFVARAISLGMKNKIISQAISTTMAGLYWRDLPEVKEKKVFSSL